MPLKTQKRHSFLLHPSDRDRFIKWGFSKRRRKKSITESNLRRQLELLRPNMAKAAQAVYDEWEQDEEGWSEVCGAGGICGDISEAIGDVIVSNIDCQLDEGGHEGDEHSYLVVSAGSEKYIIDIPHHIYESGGGYSWRKSPDAIIEPSDISIITAPVIGKAGLNEGYLEYNLDTVDIDFTGTFDDGDEMAGINCPADDGDLSAPLQPGPVPIQFDSDEQPLESDADDDQLEELETVFPEKPKRIRPSRNWLEMEDAHRTSLMDKVSKLVESRETGMISSQQFDVEIAQIIESQPMLRESIGRFIRRLLAARQARRP